MSRFRAVRRSTVVAAVVAAAVGALGATADAQTPSADLGLTAAASTDVAIPGSVVGYTLTVTNAGPDTAAGVRLVADVGSPLTLQSATGDGVACTVEANRATCAADTLAPGASATVSMVASVPADAPNLARIASPAAVGAATADPNPANDTATFTATVVGSIPLVPLPPTGTASVPSALAGLGALLAGVLLLLAARRPHPA